MRGGGSRLVCAGAASLAVTCAVLASSSPVLAAPPDEPSTAVWVGAGVATLAGPVITTDFEPPRLFGLEGSGRGGQRVAMPGDRRVSIEGGAQWFPFRHAGVEVWAARDTGTATATGVTYATSLDYTARQPPDYVPRTYRYERGDPWPAIEASIRRWTVGFNGAYRPVVGPRVTWTVTGGLAWVRVSGSTAPLGFTTFSLGGHSVLVPNEYRMRVALEPASLWRASVGTALDTALSRHLAVTIGVRVVAGGDADLRLRVRDVDRSQAGFEPSDTDAITEALSASTARVPTRSARVVAGLKVRF